MCNTAIYQLLCVSDTSWFRPAVVVVTEEPGIIKLFPSRESLVSDIPAGDGKTANLFNSVWHSPLQTFIPVSVYGVTCRFWTNNHHSCCHVMRNLSPYLLTFTEPKNRFRQARNRFLGFGVAAASVDCVADGYDQWQSLLQSRDAEPGVAAASVDCVADDNDQWQSFLQSRDAEPGAAAASADCDQPRRGSPRHCIELSTCHTGQQPNI